MFSCKMQSIPSSLLQNFVWSNVSHNNTPINVTAATTYVTQIFSVKDPSIKVNNNNCLINNYVLLCPLAISNVLITVNATTEWLMFAYKKKKHETVNKIYSSHVLCVMS